MPIHAYAGLRPVIHGTAFVHPDAVVIGDVMIGANVLIAPYASLCSYMGRLVGGDGADVQDGRRTASSRRTPR